MFLDQARYRVRWRTLTNLLTYDYKTGIFRWKVDIWKKIKAGTVAGNVGTNGYRRIAIRRRFYQAHRVAYFYMNGKWPKKDMDHINGKRDDNRWVNLREVSRSHNLANREVLGYTKCRDKFHARICVGGKAIQIGSFPTKEAARAAYIAAKLEIYPGSRS